MNIDQAKDIVNGTIDDILAEIDENLAARDIHRATANWQRAVLGAARLRICTRFQARASNAAINHRPSVADEHVNPFSEQACDDAGISRSNAQTK